MHLFSVDYFCFRNLVVGVLFTKKLVFKIDSSPAFNGYLTPVEGNDTYKKNNERLEKEY